MIEKIRKREHLLEVEEYNFQQDFQEKFVIYSDVEPLKFFENYEPFGGWTIEKYLVAQDSKLYIVTQRWSSVYDCGNFDIERVETKNINDVSRIIKKLEED